MADPIIIVDEDGIEHEFPAGFDPIRASQIVRKSKENPSLLAKAIDWIVEPTRLGTAIQTRDNQMANLIDTAERTPVHARITDVIKDAPGIAGDIASGLWNNPVATLRGGAAGLMQGIGDTVAGMSSPAALASMAAGPAGKVAVAKGLPALANVIRIGGGVGNAAMGAKGAEQVVNAPDAEGKLMGLAQAALGAHGTFSDPLVQQGARKTAVKAGEMLTRSADSAAVRNTLRATAVGAAGGAAASGHPGIGGMVAPLVIAPEAMRFAGQKLIKFGTGTSGVVPAAGATNAEPLARPDAGRTPYDTPIGETAQEAAARLQADQKGSAPVERGGFDRAMLKKQGYSDEMIERLAAADAASRRPQGAAKPNLGQGPINLTEPNVVPDTDPRVATPPEPEDLSRFRPNAFQATGNPIPRPSTNEGIPEEFLRDQYGDLPRRSDPGQDQLFGRERIGGPDTSDAAFEARARGSYVTGDDPSYEAQLAALERDQPAFTVDEDASGANYDPSQPPSGPAVGAVTRNRLLDAGNPPRPPAQLGGGEFGARKQLVAGNPDAHALPPSSMEEQMAAIEQETPPAASDLEFPPVPEPAQEAPTRFTRAQEEKTAMDEAVQQYKAAYPDADEATVRRGLSDLMDHARSEAGATAETNGQALLREIAKAGGLSIKKETGLKGEIARLKEFRDLQTRKVNGPATSAQTTNGVRGVFNDANGLPADSVLEALTRNGDPRWSHIKTLDDLTSAIQAAATEAPASQTAHIDAFKQMVQNELPKSDTLDTGETQGRLPGDVGAVRDTENPTPREEAPFSLAAESAPVKGFEQQALDAEAVPSDPAEVLKSQGLDPHEKVAIEESGVTPSKSRRSKNQMSATPGLTKSDMVAAGLNPSLKLTKITRLQARLMMDARAARHAKYYAGAKTAAAEAAAAEAE